MPWAGTYYYRSERVNGRPRRVYVGSGPVAQLAAQMDEAARKARDRERAALTRLRAEAAEADDAMRLVENLADVLSQAALLAAGFHRYHRGEWRRRRGRGPDPDD